METESKHTTLGRFPFYAGLSAAGYEQLEACTRLATLPAGSVLFRPGDACQAVPFVAAGTLRVHLRGENGREVTLYHVGTSETCALTLVCVLRRMPYPAIGIVEQPARLVLASVPAFLALLEHEPPLRQFVFEAVSARLLDVMALLNEVAFRRVDVRLAEYLLRRSAAGTAVLETHERIAAQLGSAREVVSRLLKDLERAQAIELGRGRVRVLDRAALARLGRQADEG